MSSSEKVGELFKAAGEAMTQLGLLTCQLDSNEDSLSLNKWTNVEVEMLTNSVKRFCKDLNQISSLIKTKALNNVENQLKRKMISEPQKPQTSSDDKMKTSLNQLTFDHTSDENLYE